MNNDIVAYRNRKFKNEERECSAVYRRKIFISNNIIIVIVLLPLITVVSMTLGMILYHTFREDYNSTVSDKINFDPPNFRLPLTVLPRLYVLEIKIDLSPDNLKFEGKEEINLDCMEKTNEIVIHASNLSIDEDSINLRTEDHQFIKISQIRYYPEIHLIVFKLNQYLNVNSSYRLLLSFSGNMLADGKGIFYDTYEDNQNNKNYFAATQFLPTYARKAFPCFDEPAMKAKFIINILRWKNMTSLSNMPKMNTISQKYGWELDSYQISKKMSTYLVAFVVGNFTNKTRNNISIWTYPESNSLADFVLNIAPKTFLFFKFLLQIPYEAYKLDIVGIKSDKIIAMGNPGLIFFKEHHLLSSNNSRQWREFIASKLSHQLAHQWFGSLITPIWWNDIWLNEGLSSYMEHIASKSFFPEWNKIDKTFLEINEKIIERQCNIYSIFQGRISLNIETFEDVNTKNYIFDSIIHSKGAMIIRMAHYIVGKEVFWKRLNKYLKENAYSNVDERTLWEYFSTAETTLMNYENNLTEIMLPWTHLLGQPIVSIERNYDENTAIISQISCLANKHKKHKNDIWPIPINYMSPDGWEREPKITWLRTQNMKFENMPEKNQWILVNGNGIGLYIVNYDKRNWRLLSKQLRRNYQIFSANSRFKLLNDAVVLYKLNYIRFDILLNIYAYIGYETELTILRTENIEPILTFSHIMQSMNEEYKWKEFLFYIFEPIYKRLGWIIKTDSENESTILLRNTLFRYLCENGHEDCIINTRYLFMHWKLNKIKTMNLEFDLINFCAIVKFGSREDWEFLYDLYIDKKDEYFLLPLLCTKDPRLFTRLLDIFLATEKLINIVQFFKNIFENKNLWSEFLEFFNNHFKEITNVYQLEELIKYMESFLENEVIFNKFEAICWNHMNELSESEAKILKEKLAKCKIKVLKRNREIYFVSNWLKNESWLRKKST